MSELQALADAVRDVRRTCQHVPRCGGRVLSVVPAHPTRNGSPVLAWPATSATGTPEGDGMSTAAWISCAHLGCENGLAVDVRHVRNFECRDWYCAEHDERGT